MQPSPPDVDRWLAARSGDVAGVPLSVVIPAFNERWRLPTTLVETIDYLDRHVPGYELVVVDDGSRDGTAELVKKFEKIRPQVRLIRDPKNHGKGYAVRMGVLSARGERVLFMDADGSAPVSEVERLHQALNQGAHVAIGSRAVASEETEVQARLYRKMIGRVFAFLVNVLSVRGIKDTQCGFKLFPRQVAHTLFERAESNGFGFDVELLFIAQRLGFTIAEVPIDWHHVSGSKVNLIKDSLLMVIDMVRFRWRHRHVSPHLLNDERC